MKVVIICGVIAAFLFAISFLAKKRFGLLGLALAAGSILSQIWGENLAIAANIAGLPSGNQTNALVIAVVILLPALLLMLHGSSYGSFLGRTFGALVFTALAITFVLRATGGLLTFGSEELNLYSLFRANSDYIVGVGLALSVIDLFLTKPAKKAEKGKEH